MSLERAAAACVFPGFVGAEAPDWLRRWLGRGLGGVVVFARNVRSPEQIRQLTATLRTEQQHVVIAVDEEGGDVTRLEADRGSSYPGALALGAADDVALTEAVAGAIAIDLARCGLSMNLAPVADVNTNARNPVIGVRSFGSDPALVARHVAAFVRGTQRQGVAACAKHFPGHGDTTVDSHLELPVVDGELVLDPFREAISAGVRAVMTGHLRVPQLDPDEPATLSRRIIVDLLRRELGFDGLVITDALEMRAISGRLGLGEAAARALAAGADAVCLGADIDERHVSEVHDAIVTGVRSGRLDEERVAEAAARVETLAAWARPHVEHVDDNAVRAAASRALRAEGDVRVDGAPVVVEPAAAPTIAAGPAGYGFGDAARRVWPDALICGDGFSATNGRPIVLVLRDAARRPKQQAVARELIARRPDTVVVETGFPGWRPERARGYIVTHGAARVNLDAAVALLSGTS
jgi:beta-N-acetylhexosaminidase